MAASAYVEATIYITCIDSVVILVVVIPTGFLVSGLLGFKKSWKVLSFKPQGPRNKERRTTKTTIKNPLSERISKLALYCSAMPQSLNPQPRYPADPQAQLSI